MYLEDTSLSFEVKCMNIIVEQSSKSCNIFLKQILPIIVSTDHSQPLVAEDAQVLVCHAALVSLRQHAISLVL